MRKAALLAAMLLVYIFPASAADGAPAASAFYSEACPAPDVPESARADDGYFTDAVLIGDSLSAGLSDADLLPELDVMTVIGLSPRAALTQRKYRHDGQPVNLADKLAALRPPVVYFWLGSNGLSSIYAERILADYDRLMDAVLPGIPDSIVYIMELPPVRKAALKRYPHYTNKRVDEFNAGLREVALRHNVYIITINHLLKNERGELRYSAEDGIHILKPAYELMADYMRAHTVPRQ